MYEENSYRHLTYIKTMLNELTTDVKGSLWFEYVI